MEKLKISIVVFAIISTISCKWEHHGKIFKDKDGNLYRLEASGITNESYYLEPLPTADIDSLLNN